MTDNKMFEKFVITCINCRDSARQHETHLHIDWKHKTYMVLCFGCKTTEAFNESGERLVLKPENEEDKDEGGKEEAGGSGGGPVEAGGSGGGPVPLPN